MRTWQLQEARSRFSELVSEALTQGPQRVTRHVRAVIIVSEERWNEVMQKVPSFGRMLAECPLDPDDLRTRWPARVFRSAIAG